MKVRIQRKRKTDAQMMIAWGGLLTMVARMLWQPWIDHDKTIIQDARLELTRTNTRVADMRAAKLSNELVLQDMKIEEQKMKLKLLQRELDIRGIGKEAFAPPSQYENEP